MHARRYFVEAEPSDPRAVEALAFIRTLYAVKREIKEHREKFGNTFTDADVLGLRRTRGSPSTTGRPSGPSAPGTWAIELAARGRRRRVE